MELSGIDDRKMRLKSPLGDDRLKLTSFTGREAISELYRFELQVKTERRKPIQFNDLLGEDIRVEIELPSPKWSRALTNGRLPEPKHRRFCGIVQEISELSRDSYFCYYQLIVRPRFWLLTQKADCRIFQETKVPEILQSVFDGLNVDFRLQDHYRDRPYCVQYNELTFDFAKRLMAEEGIFFYFLHQYPGQDDEHHQRGEKLIVTDSIVNLPKIGSPDSDEGAWPVLNFLESENAVQTELGISKWQTSQQIVTTKYTLRDHSFQLPGQSLEANEELPDQISIGKNAFTLAPMQQELEVYEYPGQYAKQYDGITAGGGERPETMKRVFKDNAQFATREIERCASESVQIYGESDCAQLLPAHKFALNQYQVKSGPYFVKAVEHLATLNADFRSGEPKGVDQVGHTYENQFYCQADIQPYQPDKNLKKPQINGCQTATVVGPAGKEVFSDKFGRIKVQFHWDRQGSNDANSSCWIRVAQVWAGNRWGAFFWPRVGHEVVVIFEDGDPDRPLIIGSVYNAKNMPPMELPDRLSSGGIKSCSIGGNPMQNFSCVIFHDGIGQEYLQLHSETHECLTSETSKLNFSAGPKINFQGNHDHVLSKFGSGAGGGPSESQDGGIEQIFRDQNLASFLDPELVTALESLGGLGSGSGGLITGVLTGTGAMPKRGDGAAKDAEIAGVENLPGKVEMITGDSILNRLGTETQHLFGRDTEIIADLEALIESFILGLLGGMVSKGVSDATLWQRGGHLKNVYGNKVDLTYGHEVNVRRGFEYSVHQHHFFGPPPMKGNQVPIASTVSIVIKAIAIFILLFDIAIAIAIKCIMENPPAK